MPSLTPSPGWLGTDRRPIDPAHGWGRARSAKPVICCATAPTRPSTCRRSAAWATWVTLPLPNTGLAAMREAIAPLIAPLLARHHMVWLGGDHSITLPLLRAYRAHFGRPLAVLHFDAHCDTWQDHFSEPSDHGTWVYEA